MSVAEGVTVVVVHIVLSIFCNARIVLAFLNCIASGLSSLVSRHTALEM